MWQQDARQLTNNTRVPVNDQIRLAIAEGIPFARPLQRRFPCQECFIPFLERKRPLRRDYSLMFT